MKVKTEKDRKANKRQISRLREKLASGKFNGATLAALERRQQADLDYYRSAAR